MLNELMSRIKRAGALVGAVALLAFAGQAQAISYVGQWDPAFGPPFTQLGWRGEALFEIPDACVALAGTVIVTNSSPCASGGLKMLSAEVEFYDLTNPSAVLDTLSFTTPSVVLSMTVSSNSLAAVVGGFLLPENSDLVIAGGDTDFWLGFIESDGNNYAQLGFVQYAPCGSANRCIVDIGKSQISPDPSGRPLMTFSVVPEPGILALLLPALGLLAVSRRRRSAA